MKTRIDIFTHHYFPYYMIILGIVLTPLIVIPVYPLLSVGAGVLSILLLSTHFRLSIDLHRKTYRVYLWILGFKNGREENYQSMEYLYINKLHREDEYGLVARMSYSKVIYAAYVKLADGATLFIGESTKEHKLLTKAEMLSKKLGIEMRKNY